jgi:hypothetical protein
MLCLPQAAAAIRLHQIILPDDASEAVPDEVSVKLVVDGVGGVARKAVARAGTVLGQRGLLRSSSSMQYKLVGGSAPQQIRVNSGRAVADASHLFCLVLGQRSLLRGGSSTPEKLLLSAS